MRLLAAFFLAALVVPGLFYLMYYMISPGDGDNRTASYSRVEFVRLKQDEQAQPKKRVLPEQPPLPSLPPVPPKMHVEGKMQLQMPEPDMQVPLVGMIELRSDPFIGSAGTGPANAANAELIALLKITPRYPRNAALNKIEGWVKVEFTVTESGSVIDAEVVASEPPRIFDREARRAILGFRFKPQIVDGKPVSRRAAQVIEFKLADHE